MIKNKDGWKLFVELCRETKDDKTLTHLFELLFTPEEKEDISMRCLIIKELFLQKRTQREISKNLNVSIAKITRGSNAIKSLNDQLIKYLKSKFN